MLKDILIPIISLGGLGMIAGLGLILASRFFAVEVDPRVEKVENLLAGANCGACGYPGCSGFARALVEGKVSPTSCPALEEEAAHEIGKVLGIDVGAKEKRVARVLCMGARDKARVRFEYSGLNSCRALILLGHSRKECVYGCIGLGDCVMVCPFGAIEMTADSIPKISDELCTGCGKCVDVCPKDIITVVPASRKVMLLCKSGDKAKVVRKICEVGCIGCSLCVKNCPYNARKMEDNLPILDMARCRECGICAFKCPRNIIKDEGEHKEKIEIGGDCDGCGECISACKMKALKGEPGQVPGYDRDKCYGCGRCVEICPKDAIRLVNMQESITGLCGTGFKPTTTLVISSEARNL